ncbi:hypothetical protein OAI07_00505 [Akkermansiaceae bacterium]|nr:hypothetical protein [Akkermansiaceae bacterium]
MPSKKDILDLYFIDARHRLIDVAAFLDRVDRHAGETDYRTDAFQHAIEALLNHGDKSRAQAVLEAFSDHSETPLDHASTQSASGASQV